MKRPPVSERRENSILGICVILRDVKSDIENTNCVATEGWMDGVLCTELGSFKVK